MTLARRPLLMSLIVAGSGLAGCTGPLSTLEPAGPAAERIALLWWILLAVSGLVFALLSAALLAAALRPGWVRALSPLQWIIWGGLVLPGIGLAGLVGSAVWLGETLIPRAGANAALRIDVTARRWAWEFSYPDAAGAPQSRSTNVLHIPVDRPVDLHVTSEDIIHSFWVPRLAGKLDAIPGHVNVLRLQAGAEGTYGGVCAEYCGVGHAGMVFSIRVHAEDDYEPALRALAAPGG